MEASFGFDNLVGCGDVFGQKLLATIAFRSEMGHGVHYEWNPRAAEGLVVLSAVLDLNPVFIQSYRARDGPARKWRAEETAARG